MEPSQKTVDFCGKCKKKIRSGSLWKLWQALVVHRVIYDSLFGLEQDHPDIARYCSILESKGFVVTHETADHILMRPCGITEFVEGRYLACIEIDEHFSD